VNFSTAEQAARPVYSYRLSIVHFWALIFTYMWAGPHHLHYTALPDWTQSLGMVFSLILFAPSWGGMINGIMTLSGAWHRLREDPILRFLIVALSFYGMSTFEGPMMAIKTVNALSHYTDWTIGHVHSGALGWVGLITMGSLYYLIPRLWGRDRMYSTNLIELHFWLATIGIALYAIALWVAGVTQGLMWRALEPDGTLTYTFADIDELYWSRTIGPAVKITRVGEGKARRWLLSLVGTESMTWGSTNNPADVETNIRLMLGLESAMGVGVVSIILSATPLRRTLTEVFAFWPCPRRSTVSP